MSVVFFALIGACVGSFLTVLLPRFRHDEPGIVFGRSRCVETGRTLKWHELIPVFSYLFLGGKIKDTSGKIPLFYPLTELVGALLWGLAAYQFGIGWHLAPILFALTGLLAIGAYDARWGLVDRRLSIPLIMCFIVWAFFREFSWHLYLISGALVGVFFWLQYAFSKGRWCGQGDIDLGIMAGLCVVVDWSFLLLFFSYILGSFTLLVWYALHKSLPKTIPMGPFLAASAAAFLLWGSGLADWYFSIIMPTA